MATAYTDLGPDVLITITGTIKAKPGKADEVAQRLANLKVRADSDVEPGTLSYNIVRYGDSFAVFEEYANAKAVEAHQENPLFKELVAQRIIESIVPVYYPGKSLPPPTMRF